MYTTVVHNQKLVDSMDVEQLVGRADCKAICKFSTAQKVGALMSLLFKGQLYICIYCKLQPLKIIKPSGIVDKLIVEILWDHKNTQSKRKEEKRRKNGATSNGTNSKNITR